MAADTKILKLKGSKLAHCAVLMPLIIRVNNINEVLAKISSENVAIINLWFKLSYR